MVGPVRFQYFGYYWNYDPRSGNKYDHGAAGLDYGTHANDRNIKSNGKQRQECTENFPLQRNVPNWRRSILGKSDRDRLVVTSEIREGFSVKSKYLLCFRSPGIFELGL